MAFKISPEKHAAFVARHKAAKTARTAELIARLDAAVTKEGPDSIYAEMLAEMKESK